MRRPSEPWQKGSVEFEGLKRGVKMNHRYVVTAMVLGASMLTGEAMYAAPVAVHAPVYAMYGNVKTVKFTLHNNTNQVLKVKAGDTDLTLEPGKTVALKLAIGQKVVAAEQTQSHQAGEVLVVASDSLSDATIHLN
jgi:hypothetical protein